MPSILDDFQQRRSLLFGVNFEDACPRLGGLIDWLESIPPVKSILNQIRKEKNAPEILKGCNRVKAPKISSPDEIASVGIFFMERCRENQSLWNLAINYGIGPPYSTRKVQDYSDALLDRFINPALDMIESKLTVFEEGISPENIFEHRFVSLISNHFRTSYPVTSKLIEKLATIFIESGDAHLWNNIGNTCREILLSFTQELRNNIDYPIPEEIKGGDVKNITSHILKAAGLKGHYEETLEKLMEAIWNHVQTVLHRKQSTRSDAERCYLFTVLVISEINKVLEMRKRN